MLRQGFTFLAFSCILLVCACCGEMESKLTDIPFEPESYMPNIPSNFPPLEVPEDNQLTVQGIDLGRHLFYDPILSSDSTKSCSSCHLPEGNFTDNLKLSEGVTGEFGTRSSMTLLNVGFSNTGLFWDGRVATLEEQALIPVEDPIELHDSWPNVEAKLQRHKDYPTMFRKAFGIENNTEITRDLAVKAIAQFERILISSGNAKYDQVIAGADIFSDLELDGHDIFFDINEDATKHAECGHCHNAPLFTTNEFFNNGLDAVSDLNDFADQGRGGHTGRPFDLGTFKVPTLRNINFSAPYMHDGRFGTLDEVIDHYITGGNHADNLAPVLRPLNLTDYDRSALIAFIKTLEDQDFIDNPMLSNPFE